MLTMSYPSESEQEAAMHWKNVEGIARAADDGEQRAAFPAAQYLRDGQWTNGVSSPL